MELSRLSPAWKRLWRGWRSARASKLKFPPEESYGIPDASAFREVRKDYVPSEAMHLGAQLQGRSQSGQVVYARVAQLKEETVIVDFNHPLAGKTLYFDVKVLNIQEAPPE